MRPFVITFSVAITIWLRFFCILQPLCASGSQGNAPDVAATVGDYNVLVSEVDAEFRRIVGDQQPTAEAASLIRATALEQLVKRQLVMAHLQRKKFLPNETQLQVRIDLLAEGLQKVDKTLAEHLVEQKISEDKFRESVAWNMGWKSYLDRYVTDENIETYFKRNRADFDGTRVHVAHILLKVEKEATKEESFAALKSLQNIRRQIESGELTFTDAAKKHSQASTSETGGDIGLIERYHPMPKAFSNVAFSLKPGATSQPVQTAFGWHLIHCLKIEPGTEELPENRDEIVAAMNTYLFEWLADSERKNTKVVYTGNVADLENDAPGLNQEQVEDVTE